MREGRCLILTFSISLGPVWESNVFLKSVSYRPTLSRFRGGPVKKITLYIRAHESDLQNLLVPSHMLSPSRNFWILHHRCLSFFLYFFLFLYLSLYLFLYLSFRPNLDSWHHGLLENIWFEGSLRSDGSVTAYLWTQEKLLEVDGTGEIIAIGSTTGPRGPENHPVYSY